MAQRTGAEISAEHLLHVRMITVAAAEAGERLQLGGIEVAEIGEQWEPADGGMTLGQHESVTISPLRVARIDAQLRVVQRREQFRGGERGRVVTGAGNARQTHRLGPYEPGAIGQFGYQLGALLRPASRKHVTQLPTAPDSERIGYITTGVPNNPGIQWAEGTT